MCELLAIHAAAPAPACGALGSFLPRGGLTGEHADGWGIAYHHGHRCQIFGDHGPAAHSPLAAQLLRRRLAARTVLAHVRKATQGEPAAVNCHPFRRRWAGRSWLFAHNGDLKGFQPPLAAPWLPQGQTDSERAFCWLMQGLAQRHGARPATLPAWPQLAEELAPRLREIAVHGRFNAVLSDGEGLLVHADDRLHAKESGSGRVVLASVPAGAQGDTDTDTRWEALQRGELRLYLAGRRVSRSLAAPLTAPLAQAA